MSDASEESDADEPEYVGSIQPYMFEPTMTAEEAAARRAVKRKTDSETDGRHAADIQTWCKCQHCVTMPTDTECCCCREISQVMKRCSEVTANPECITVHPGFYSVALCPYSLQAAYFGYRQNHGRLVEPSINERYRYTAYRNFVRWCREYVGKHVRVTLPSCVVKAIRDKFPSDSYHGFQLPPLD